MADMEGFDFYQSVFRGQKLNREQWDQYAPRARDWLERYRSIYLVEASAQALEMAVCAMAEALYSLDDGGGAVRSASIGSVSVQYGDREDVSSRGQERMMLQILRRYAHVYRGVSG